MNKPSNSGKIKKSKAKKMTEALLSKKNKFRSGLGFRGTNKTLEMKKKTINDAVIKKKIVEEIRANKRKGRKSQAPESDEEGNTEQKNVGVESDASSSVERKLSKQKNKKGRIKYKNEFKMML
jgi:hypothetical protein